MRSTPLRKWVRSNLSKKTNNPNPSPIGKRFGLYGFGAGGGGRTRTVSLPMDFESTSSANSNTPAFFSRRQLNAAGCSLSIICFAEKCKQNFGQRTADARSMVSSSAYSSCRAFVPASEGAEARGPEMRDPGPEKVEGKVKNDALAPPRFLSQGSKKAPGTENRSIHPRRPNKYNNTSDSAPCFSGRESV